MARLLPPPPIKGDLPTPFRDWLNKLYTFLGDTSNLILWNQINTSGSELDDITTRPHSQLQAVSGSSEQVHVSATERTNLQELADGTDTTLHFHESDRDSANFTGTDWIDLTDTGATTLHKHDHNAQDGKQGGTTAEYYHLTAAQHTANALKTDKLSAFAATSSSELAGVITDETGSGALVFGTSPTLTGPTISSGNLTFSGTGQRITGDFSNATQTSRVLFQDSTANSNTGVGAIPNGSSSISNFTAFSAADPANSSYGRLLVRGGTDTLIESGATGTGTYLPLLFSTNGSEAARITTTQHMELQGTLKTQGYTVATLPGAGTLGRIAYVTDALAPTFLAVLVGGGAVKCPVFDNGTNWVAF